MSTIAVGLTCKPIATGATIRDAAEAKKIFDILATDTSSELVFAGGGLGEHTYEEYENEN